MPDMAAINRNPLSAPPALRAESRALIVDLQSALHLDALCKALQALLLHEAPDGALLLRLAAEHPADSTHGIHFPLGNDGTDARTLSIDRPAGGPPLSAAEHRLLDYLRPMIEAGLRRIQVTQTEEQRLRSYEYLLARMPTATQVFSAKGELQFATPEGRKLSQRWKRGLRDADSRAQLKHQLAETVARAGPQASGITLQHPTIKGLGARIERQLHAPALQQQTSYLIEFSDTATEAKDDSEAAPLTPEAWLALQKLSIAERKVALLAAQGLSNEEIARHRCRSPRTIEYQLHLIFRKLEIRRRAQLVRLLS